MITLTSAATNKINEQLTKRGKGLGIRVGVKTTGCSGLAYTMEYADVWDPQTDIELESANAKIYVSKKDMVFLDGMTIDYIRKGLSEGFDFVNPNEKDRCGCGESFRV